MVPGQILYDKQIPGLHVKAFANKKSFYLYYRTREGLQRRPKLADVATITLAQARVIARERLFKIAKGEDPAHDPGEITVAKLFEKIYAEYWSQERFKKSSWGYEAAGGYHRHIEKPLGEKTLSELTPLSVKAWHQAIRSKTGAKAPFAANRALSVLSKMLSFAEENELKLVAGNPCAKVEPFPERKRSKYASHAELVKLNQALQREYAKYPKQVAFIYLILYTGARPKMLTKILWKDVVEENGCGVAMFFGKGSADSGEDEMLIIPPQVYKMLVDIHNTTPIPSLTGINMPRKFWKRICAECGIVGLWARDLRRTFATIGFQSNDLAKVGEVLNHRSTQTTLIYARLNASSRIATVSGIADRINTIVDLEKEKA